MEFQVKLVEIESNLDGCLKSYNNVATYMERTDPDRMKDKVENFMSIKDIQQIEGPFHAFIVPEAYHQTKVPCFYSSDVSTILKSSPAAARIPKVSSTQAPKASDEERESKHNLAALTEKQIYHKSMRLAEKLKAQMSKGADCKSKPTVVEFGTEYIKLMQELITKTHTKTLKEHPLDTIEVLYN